MRTAFIIDGFNLYHSVRKAEADFRPAAVGTKWLNLRRLCTSLLYLVGRSATLEHIYYFSALATHLEGSKPDVTARHRAYVECLSDSGVRVELSRFKAKDIRCPHCTREFQRHEEKETDVALAVRLLEIFTRDECDAAVLITGDTDIAPAVRTAQRLFPSKTVCFGFPYARKNKELAQLVDTSFHISKETYAKNQFPDPYVLSSGATVSKPARW